MGTRRGVDHHQVPRFLCSQAIMLAMQGIPAVYIHSLTASPNDLDHVEQTGRTRSINRRIWDKNELEYLLGNPVTHQAEVFTTLTRMIRIRRDQKAFNPDTRQDVIKINTDLFILKRTSTDGEQRIYAISNVTERILRLPLASLGFLENGLKDILALESTTIDEELVLYPYQTVWLTQA
jgi:sucrose phosphorylase